MKKILIGITHLNIGGAEKVLVDLCNELSKTYDVTIFMLYKGGSLENNLDKKIKKKYFFNSMKLNIVSKLIFKINMFFSNKKYFIKKINTDNYDTYISFLEGPITHIFSMIKEKKIAFVHTNLDKQYSGIKKIIENFRNKKTYKKYDDIVFVSNSTLDSFNKTYNINKPKHVIYNYINIENVINKSNEEEIKLSSDFNFLCVCRLTPSKGILRLLDIHKKLIDNKFNHKIYIVGDGVLYDDINLKIKELNVCDSFILLGKKDNPYPYIKACDMFILPSLYEGFGMVLVEAIILKKPVLTTKTGAVEAIGDYKNSIISDNNFDSIYENMKKVISTKIINNEDYLYTNEKNLKQIKDLINK